ncbi:PREDICTED: uncharacterized protein LOC106743735 isoform X2 [Dinoponera quadriceps]|uniref:Uncharacterized protein LOC106743735 isoform X2 n=1 Tax=Dinoponera quadriceps TaxID=609295 RepID=A0A6P3X542_DINQU|nr:PREDICTED: uncharacterized protein LOC106743735 isoform X2 [Dinoponera quadriceps]
MRHPKVETPRAPLRKAPKENKFSPGGEWDVYEWDKYVDKYFGAAKMKSVENEGKKSGVLDDVARRRTIFENKNIIIPPTYCPEGEQEDSKGICREYIPS